MYALNLVTRRDRPLPLPLPNNVCPTESQSCASLSAATHTHQGRHSSRAPKSLQGCGSASGEVQAGQDQAVLRYLLSKYTRRGGSFTVECASWQRRHFVKSFAAGTHQESCLAPGSGAAVRHRAALFIKSTPRPAGSRGLCFDGADSTDVTNRWPSADPHLSPIGYCSSGDNDMRPSSIHGQGTSCQLGTLCMFSGQQQCYLRKRPAPCTFPLADSTAT